MATSYLPESFGSILERFRGCFTAPSHGNFIRLVSGWLLCRGRHTISRVVQAAETVMPRVHHARLYRFFSRARWEPDTLGRVVLDLVLPLLPDVVQASIDDTLCKKGGPQIFGAAMHRDGSASNKRGGGGARFAFGHNWVVLCVRVALPFAPGRGLAVPILARLYRGKKRCPAKRYVKRTELARQMIGKLAAWLPEGRSLSLVGDAEYACRTVVRQLPEGACFVGPVCRDAALHEPPAPYGGRGRPALRGARLPNPQQLADDARVRWRTVHVELYGRTVTLRVKTITCLWPTVARSRLVRIVLTRDPSGRLQDRCYFGTDPSLSAEEILMRVAHRWELEVTFRDIKQILGMEDPQNGWWRRRRGRRRNEQRPGPEPRADRGRRAVERTVPIALVAHAMVVVWYLGRNRAAQDVQIARRLAPWRRDKRHPCFSDMLAALREAIWRERLSAYPLPDRVRRKLIRLLAPTWRSAA